MHKIHGTIKLSSTLQKLHSGVLSIFKDHTASHDSSKVITIYNRCVLENLLAAGIIVALIVVPASALAGQNPQARKRGPTQLPFRLSHGVLIEIKGRIGRLGDLRFALDTGTTETVVDRRVADRLHLLCKPGTSLLSFNGSLKLEQCVLPDIQIGSFRVKGLLVYVDSLTRLSTFLDDADALVGLDVLGASRFTVDYEKHEVTFDSMKRPAPPPADDPEDPLCMYVVIRVQGRPIRLIVDTGIEGALLYENRLRSRLPHLRILPGSQEVTVGRRMPAEQVTLPDVRIGRAETSLVVLLISGPPKNTLPGIDGFLGVSELGARQLTFDFVAKTLTWER